MPTPRDRGASTSTRRERRLDTRPALACSGRRHRVAATYDLVVRARKRWNDLDPRARRFVVVASVIESVLKIAALIDLARRSSNEVRGSKAGWAAAISLLNSFGAVPIAYFVWGRRKPDEVGRLPTS